MGLGHPRQTAFVRSLHSAGIPVHAVHTQLNAYRFSRRLASFTRLGMDPEEQLRHLEKFGQETGGILIPTNDEYVALVAQNRERLARHFIIPLPDWEVVGVVLDRGKSYALAESAGIKVPRLWAPDSYSEMAATVAALQPQARDYILKTRSVLSIPADEASVRHTRAAPKDRSEILNACVEMEQRTGHYPLIQEVIPGAADSAIGVTMVISTGDEIILAYCVRRLRLATYKIGAGYVHPYELGSVVWCETVHDPDAVEAAREVVKRLRYTGIITVEFRRDPSDNSLYLMKIEPRPVRATSLSRVIGMDIPTALHATFAGGTPKVADDYPDGIGWLWIQACAVSLVRNPHHTRRDLLRVLRNSHSIKALGEDFFDVMPNVVDNAGILRRRAAHNWRRLFGRKAELTPSSS
jgi:predicted ATP-grasp superfamily ATP-dependent carboligase